MAQSLLAHQLESCQVRGVACQLRPNCALAAAVGNAVAHSFFAPVQEICARELFAAGVPGGPDLGHGVARPWARRGKCPGEVHALPCTPTANVPQLLWPPARPPPPLPFHPSSFAAAGCLSSVPWRHMNPSLHRKLLLPNLTALHLLYSLPGPS